jgi:hypothetical protein
LQIKGEVEFWAEDIQLKLVWRMVLKLLKKKTSYSHVDFYSINSQTTQLRVGLVTNVFYLCNRSEFSPLKLKNKENSSTVLITATFIA